MSLVWFHRFLIAGAIAFCLGFALWQVEAWRDSGGTAALLLAATFALLAVGLMFYLRRLRRFLDLPDER